jgi:hypothetical protein
MFGSTIIIAISFATLVLKVSNRTRLENDGCLMAMLVVLLSFAGMGFGFWIGKFPFFILSSLVGALGFPTIATSVWLRVLTKKG